MTLNRESVNRYMNGEDDDGKCPICGCELEYELCIPCEIALEEWIYNN